MTRPADRCRPLRPLALGIVLIATGFLAAPAHAAIRAYYNRPAAVAYATQYANKVVTDGYFWIDSGTCKYYGPGVAAPSGSGLAGGVGDDCAHFVSSCIGTPSGGGVPVDQPLAGSSSASYRAQYGNPSASGLTSWLLANCATKASSVLGLAAGDMIAYDWTGNGSIDHVVFYMGNGKIAAHAASHLNVSYNWAAASYPNEKLTYVHIALPDAAATPEPTTLAALGSLFVLARRRRRAR